MIDRVETAPDHLVSSNAFEIKICNSRWGLRLGGGELASNLCRNIYFSLFFCLIWICDERQRVLFSAYRKWSVCPSHWWTPSTNCLRHNKPSWLLLATFNNSWWKDLLLKRNRHIRQEPWGTIGHDSCLRSRPAGRRRRFEKKKKKTCDSVAVFNQRCSSESISP